MKSMLNHKRKRLAFAGVMASLLLLGGCGLETKELISEDLISEDEGFGVSTAAYGDYKETKTYSASLVYPTSTIITSDYDGVLMDHICVESGDVVKKGDLLVSIQQITPEVIANQEAAITKYQEELNQGIGNYQSQIESFRASIAASSGTQRQIYSIQEQKVERQLRYYQENGAREQDEMRQKLEKLKTLQGDINIYAPYDGVIDSVQAVPENTELTSQRELLTMHSEDALLIQVTDGSELKYNMSVSVSAGYGENRKTFTGHVISANNVLDDAYQTGAAYIKLDGEASVDELKNIEVTADVRALDHVLLVKEYAVSSQKEERYVSIIDEDRIMKRRVVTGGGNGDMVWVVKGLLEGQSVLIQ